VAEDASHVELGDAPLAVDADNAVEAASTVARAGGAADEFALVLQRSLTSRPTPSA
jgi:hypothetical protein